MAITIKCTKCGNENPLGDLFCRQCGTELDMNTLDPGEVRIARKKNGCFKTLFEFIYVVLIFGFFALMVMLFMAPSGVSFPSLQDDVYTKKIGDAVGALKITEPGDKVVKQDNAGGVFQSIVIKESGTYAVIKVEGDLIAFSFRKLYYGIPFTFTMYGTLEESDASDDYHWRVGQNTSFAITDTRVGMIPTGKLTLLHIRKYFLSFLDGKDFKELPEQIASIKLTPEKDFLVTPVQKKKK